MPAQRNNWATLAIGLVWLLIAFFIVQGYFILKGQSSRSAPPGKVAVKPKSPKPPEPKVAEPPAQDEPGKGAVIAVVIDDWGYNRSHCSYLESISAPLGIAVLPNLPYSRDVLACAATAGKDAMLHLPIEPHNPRESFDNEYTLTTDMSAAQARKILRKILSEMNGVVGVNNHTGSKGTEDKALMKVVLTEIRRSKLYFVDSVTSQTSVCGEVASELAMKIGRRDVFLDNRNERAYIEKQFAMAAKIARQKGYCLVIGHDRALTLQVIKEQTEKLERQGYRFILPREYVKSYGHSRN